MSRALDYEERATALITPIVEANGFELVDLEYVREGGNYFLRAYIDKPGGITIDDCELVSRAFSDELDREDFISDPYVLEVSSPGLGRPLKKEKDFVRHTGDEVEIRLYKPFEGSKEYSGKLVDHDADSVVIETEKDKYIRIARADIALIRLAIDF